MSTIPVTTDFILVFIVAQSIDAHCVCSLMRCALLHRIPMGKCICVDPACRCARHPKPGERCQATVGPNRQRSRKCAACRENVLVHRGDKSIAACLTRLSRAIEIEKKMYLGDRENDVQCVLQAYQMA